MINIKNLHVSIDEQEILKGINLNVNAGELHIIMGRNGTGKSTLASVLAGREIYNISQGDLHFAVFKPIYDKVELEEDTNEYELTRDAVAYSIAADIKF